MWRPKKQKETKKTGLKTSKNEFNHEAKKKQFIKHGRNQENQESKKKKENCSVFYIVLIIIFTN